MSTETSFAVKDRVKVELPDVPLEQRNCDAGVITQIAIRFRDTKFERITYEVTFDENYIKKEFVLWDNFNKITVEACRLTKI